MQETNKNVVRVYKEPNSYSYYIQEWDDILQEFVDIKIRSSIWRFDDATPVFNTAGKAKKILKMYLSAKENDLELYRDYNGTFVYAVGSKKTSNLNIAISFKEKYSKEYIEEIS
jgi:hypothetical protein